ncbi:uncharacterized protein VP01_1275g1, partial [Puccinia sorghi]
ENKLIIPWKTDNHELADFKSKTILAILGFDESLFTYTNNLESSNQVLKLANSSFKDFLDAASLVMESKTITFTLIQEHPKFAIWVSTTPQEPPPTAGAASGATLHKNIQKIFENHDASEQFSHLNEKPVHINPENPQEYFVITMIKAADAWARAMVKARTHQPRKPVGIFCHHHDQSRCMGGNGKLLYQLIFFIVTKFMNDSLNTPSKLIPKRLLQLPLQNHSNTALAQLEGIKEMMMIIRVIQAQPCIAVTYSPLCQLPHYVLKVIITLLEACQLQQLFFFSCTPDLMIPLGHC